MPVPLHIIFRSVRDVLQRVDHFSTQGSLLASLLLGKLLLKRSYSYQKYVSVGMITAGIVICTLATQPKDHGYSYHDTAGKYYFEWLIGKGTSAKNVSNSIFVQALPCSPLHLSRLRTWASRRNVSTRSTASTRVKHSSTW